MKRTPLLFLLLGALTLAACGDDEGPSNDVDVIDGVDDGDTFVDTDSVDGDADADADGDGTSEPTFNERRAALSPLPANSMFARKAGEDGECADEDYSTPAPADTPYPSLPAEGSYETLSEYGFFWGDMKELNPVDGVIPYSTASFLWADGTGKARFIVLPEGEQATFDEGELWDFPEGTIVIKNFLLTGDEENANCNWVPVETRLLFRRGDTWDSETYLWNEDYTEAVRKRDGGYIQIPYPNDSGRSITYYLPTRGECATCHGRNDGEGDKKINHLLGVTTFQMNVDVYRDGEFVNQLDWLEEQGLFGNEVPDPDTLDRVVNPMDEDEVLDDRVRSYFHANCAHCHRDQGIAERSQLYLTWDEEDLGRRGFCKNPLAPGPGAGGRPYDVVPGAPEESIIVYRMDTTEPQARMPELGTLQIDEFGVDLVTEWIENLEGACE